MRADPLEFVEIDEQEAFTFPVVIVPSGFFPHVMAVQFDL